MDRFNSEIPDPAPVHECNVCGTEIYEGEPYYNVYHVVSCMNQKCLAEVSGAVKQIAGEES